MKIRTGFVSNSSSSSFLVCGGIIFEIPHMSKTLIDRETMIVPFLFGGEVEFGRQRQNYHDFGSRLNFAYLQAQSVAKCADTGGKKFRDEFYKEHEAFIDAHRNDINRLEKVLIDNIPELRRIKWCLVDYEYANARQRADFSDEIEPASLVRLTGDEAPDKVVVGYIDHGSLWYEREENYTNIFESDETIFQWLFGKGNYIANRSDEYEDAGDLEVNHAYDYSWDIDLHYNPWDHPEKFDKGVFIG